MVTSNDDMVQDLIGSDEEDDIAPEVKEVDEHARIMQQIQLVMRLQQGFPVATYPYDNISKEFGMTERDVFDSAERLLSQGAIVRIGAIFEPARLGYVAAMGSMATEDEDLEDVIRLLTSIHSIPQVVECEGERNLWFTIVEPNVRRLDHQLAQIANKSGYDVRVFRPTHVFKNDTSIEIDPTVPKHLEHPAKPVVLASVRLAALSDIDRQIVRVLQGDISGERRPFSVIARMTADTCGEHLSEEEVMRRITRWCDSGVIRRFGAILDSARFGYGTRALVTWNVADKLTPALAAVFSAQPEIKRVICRSSSDDGLGNVIATVCVRSISSYQEMMKRIQIMLAKTKVEQPKCEGHVVTRVIKDVSARYFSE